jgi:hypothetical protein
MKNIAIVHYNTPELVEACILSVRKVGCEWPVTVLDNSDERPFTKRMKGVKVLNNRKQQLVNFNKEIERFPDRCEELSYKGNFASVKHMMSVDYLFDVLTDGFILMDSDVLITQPFDYLWDEEYAASGHVLWTERRGGDPDRLRPFLCYLNVPKLIEHGVRYYDPTRCWGLMPGGKKNRNNLYDTGASLLADIRKKKPVLRCRNWQYMENGYIHFGAGSYHKNDVDEQRAWLEKNEKLWGKPATEKRTK